MNSQLAGYNSTRITCKDILTNTDNNHKKIDNKTKNAPSATHISPSCVQLSQLHTSPFHFVPCPDAACTPSPDPSQAYATHDITYSRCLDEPRYKPNEKISFTCSDTLEPPAKKYKTRDNDLGTSATNDFVLVSTETNKKLDSSNLSIQTCPEAACQHRPVITHAYEPPDVTYSTCPDATCYTLPDSVPAKTLLHSEKHISTKIAGTTLSTVDTTNSSIITHAYEPPDVTYSSCPDATCYSLHDSVHAKTLLHSEKHISTKIAGTTLSTVDTTNNSRKIKLPENPNESYHPPTPTEFKTVILTLWPKINNVVWNNNVYIDIYNKVLATGVPNFLVAKQPLPSGLNINNWRTALKGYTDHKLIDFLNFGWPIDYTLNKIPTATLANHKELIDYSHCIEKYITIETSLKALLGPFLSSPFTPWCNFSPIMTRKKKNSSDRRIIVNLSYPKGRSVNSGIKKGFYLGEKMSFTLPTINDVIINLQNSPCKKYMWSIDLAHAYRQLRTDPLSLPLLGITFNNMKYIDLAPPFGCRTSAMACARTTSAVVYILNHKGFKTFCYLDDFLGIENSLHKATVAYDTALELLNYLGREISEKKCIPPSQTLTWIGYNINAKDMVITIPNEKLLEIIEECKAWSVGALVCKKQVQMLAGKLNFIAKCIQPTKIFMNRILAFLRETPKYGKIPVTQELIEDIKWFIEFAQEFNGLILLEKEKKPIWTIECDACLEGAGGYSSTSYISEKFTNQFKKINLKICQIEAINLVACMELLCPDNPHNYDIVIHTDNQTAQSVFSSGYGKDKILTACARYVWKFSALNNCKLQIIHKPGIELQIADAMSRAFTSKNSLKIATNYCLNNNLIRTRALYYKMYCIVCN